MIFLTVMGVALYFCYVAWLLDYLTDRFLGKTIGLVILIVSAMTPLAIILQILYSLEGK
jgi:hypothetical protein